MVYEEYDIYADLDDVNLKDQIKSLQDEVTKLQKQVIAKDNEIFTLQEQGKEVWDTNKQLLRNISTLMKTAKLESERKDKIIAELRKEKDDIIFRRNRNVQSNSEFKSRNSFNRKPVENNKPPFSSEELFQIPEGELNQNKNKRKFCEDSAINTKKKRKASPVPDVSITTLKSSENICNSQTLDQTKVHIRSNQKGITDKITVVKVIPLNDNGTDKSNKTMEQNNSKRVHKFGAIEKSSRDVEISKFAKSDTNSTKNVSSYKENGKETSNGISKENIAEDIKVVRKSKSNESHSSSRAHETSIRSKKDLKDDKRRSEKNNKDKCDKKETYRSSKDRGYEKYPKRPDGERKSKERRDLRDRISSKDNKRNRTDTEDRYKEDLQGNHINDKINQKKAVKDYTYEYKKSVVTHDKAKKDKKQESRSTKKISPDKIVSLLDSNQKQDTTENVTTCNSQSPNVVQDLIDVPEVATPDADSVESINKCNKENISKAVLSSTTRKRHPRCTYNIESVNLFPNVYENSEPEPALSNNTKDENTKADSKNITDNTDNEVPCKIINLNNSSIMQEISADQGSEKSENKKLIQASHEEDKLVPGAETPTDLLDADIIQDDKVEPIISNSSENHSDQAAQKDDKLIPESETPTDLLDTDINRDEKAETTISNSSENKCDQDNNNICASNILDEPVITQEFDSSMNNNTNIELIETNISTKIETNVSPQIETNVTPEIETSTSPVIETKVSHETETNDEEHVDLISTSTGNILSQLLGTETPGNLSIQEPQCSNVCKNVDIDINEMHAILKAVKENGQMSENSTPEINIAENNSKNDVNSSQSSSNISESQMSSSICSTDSERLNLSKASLSDTNSYTLKSHATKYECAVDNRNCYSIKLNRIRKRKIN